MVENYQDSSLADFRMLSLEESVEKDLFWRNPVGLIMKVFWYYFKNLEHYPEGLPEEKKIDIFNSVVRRLNILKHQEKVGKRDFHLKQTLILLPGRSGLALEVWRGEIKWKTIVEKGNERELIYLNLHPLFLWREGVKILTGPILQSRCLFLARDLEGGKPSVDILEGKG